MLVFVIVVGTGEGRRPPALHLIGHVGSVEALDQLGQVCERPAWQGWRSVRCRRALLAAVVAARGVDVDGGRRTCALPSSAKPPPSAIAASSGSCGANRSSTCFCDRRPPGLVVVDHDAAVLGDVDAVGARREAEAVSRRQGRERRRPRCRMLAVPRPAPGSVAANQRAKRWKLRAPEGLDPRRAAERGEVRVGDSRSAPRRCRRAELSG